MIIGKLKGKRVKYNQYCNYMGRKIYFIKRRLGNKDVELVDKKGDHFVNTSLSVLNILED